MATLDRPVLDYGHHSAAYRDGWIEMARELHEQAPDLAWMVLHCFPPTGGVGRTVHGSEILGQPIASGEKVRREFGDANRDPKQFDNRDQLPTDRGNANEHLSFSAGQPRCVGSALANPELDIGIETILRRLPDVVIDDDDSDRYAAVGQPDGFTEVPVTFTPGERLTDAAPVES